MRHAAACLRRCALSHAELELHCRRSQLRCSGWRLLLTSPLAAGTRELLPLLLLLLLLLSWVVAAAAQKKTTEKAMQKQATATHGLSRSPMRANFQNRPLNLWGVERGRCSFRWPTNSKREQGTEAAATSTATHRCRRCRRRPLTRSAR